MHSPVALLMVKNVNLVELACALTGSAKQDSQYKKLQRFFRFFELPDAELARLLVKLLGVGGPWRLTLDRTNWPFGQTDLNILMLGIVHQGIAWPLVWLALPKAGNSHTDERITLLEIFLDLFGREQIERLLGDREARWSRLAQLAAAARDPLPPARARELPSHQRAGSVRGGLEALPLDARQSAAAARPAHAGCGVPMTTSVAEGIESGEYLIRVSARADT